MLTSSIWITGVTRSGKTTRLVQEFRRWVQAQLEEISTPLQKTKLSKPHPQLAPAILVFAANDDNRRELADQLSSAVFGSYPVVCKTPLGFIADEVILFWPLLFEILHLKAQFPLRLRPETEQELATRLWRSHLDPQILQKFGGESRYVRRTLDLLQLAGASGINAEDIPAMLEQGLPNPTDNGEFSQIWQQMGELLQQWRKWCLERGLLSYGLIYELYWRYLLPNPTYQSHLTRRYRGIFADDVDDYPAIFRDLGEFLLNQGVFALFTYNTQGQIRLGLNADPQYLQKLSDRCHIETLNKNQGLAATWGETIIQLIRDPIITPSLPSSFQSIQTSSRAELLRKTTALIIDAIKNQQIQPQDIAIIAPGLDEIARYSLIEILSHQGIPVEPLNEQRPLISSPIIRSLLTLLGLVYPGLGRLIDQNAVAEMLIILSRQPSNNPEDAQTGFSPIIDPVRGGLLADHCYDRNLEHPQLLPVESFPRWDRLGYRATEAYQKIVQWIEKTRFVSQNGKFVNPSIILDQAIQHFFKNALTLPYDQLAAIRELMETSQHYWEVDRRLRQNEAISQPQTTAIAQFIQLLRRGTISANPRPLYSFGKTANAITLATIFQYRSLRHTHRWQFWLDSSSVLWDKGGAANLFAAPLFLREWSGKTWLSEDQVEFDQQRLERILWDLLGRVTERVYFCHSELGINGTEQMGPLFPLVTGIWG